MARLANHRGNTVKEQVVTSCGFAWIGPVPAKHLTEPQSNLDRVLREQRITQVELARRLRTSEATVSRWVNGQVPRPISRKRIARALRIPEAELWPS
jgi:hypothetical protein